MVPWNQCTKTRPAKVLVMGSTPLSLVSLFLCVFADRHSLPTLQGAEAAASTAGGGEEGLESLVVSSGSLEQLTWGRGPDFWRKGGAANQGNLSQNRRQLVLTFVVWLSRSSLLCSVANPLFSFSVHYPCEAFEHGGSCLC